MPRTNNTRERLKKKQAEKQLDSFNIGDNKNVDFSALATAAGLSPAALANLAAAAKKSNNNVAYAAPASNKNTNANSSNSNSNNNSNNNKSSASSVPEQKTVVQGNPEQYKEKGNKAFLVNEFPEALENYNKAIQLDGSNHAVYSNRSATHLALKDYDSALRDAEKCIQLMPNWSKGYLRKGEALAASLRYIEALDAYRQGLAVDADDKLIKPTMQKLQELVDELKMSQAQLAQGSNPDQDRFDNMVRWMRDGGSKFPMLYLQYYSEDYRGVHCLTKIPSNQMILYVPLSHIMTSEVAKESNIGRKIIIANVDLRSKHSYLAAYLLQERDNPQSFWKPYLDILPQKYRNMPIFFTPDELKLLKGSFTYEKIEDRKNSLKQEFESICLGVPEFDKFKLEEFIWARLVVITRIFGLVVKGKKTDGLVPYADMLNHKRPASGHHVGESESETKWTFDDNLNGFTITTLKACQRGDEVFDSYGRKCNSRFFINYGFTLDNNEDNEAVLKLTLPFNDPHYDMKIRFLGGQPTSANREYQVPANYREKKSKEMFAFLRFAHARDEEIVLLPSDLSKLEELEPISVRNEINVLKHVRQAAKAILAGFETSLEDDEKLLQLPRSQIDSNVRNCIVMRHGEKTVLHWYINLADQVIPMFEQPWKDLKKKAARYQPDASALDHYIATVVVALAKQNKNNK